MQPSEFWGLTETEFYWLLASKLKQGRGPRFSEADFDELIAWDIEAKAKHGNPRLHRRRAREANYGTRASLRIAGVPVGQEMPSSAERGKADSGSIIIVVATDAPLLPHQLDRIAKRAGLGLARMGSFAGNGSGDIFVAFSTANAKSMGGATVLAAEFLENDELDVLFEATAQATEEAIVNSMVVARDMVGNDGHVAKALPHEKLQALLKRYGRAGTRPAISK